ncbi:MULTISPECIES: fimbrial biogenesis chaperone [unclassified Serratia (in: enterobacteria)]|uniref:fimbrial biogenesis chaperone n=1 Tax=unclassified Serratia (in: enterobacteria) TaxID=2647522 RepID=UPI00307652DC
MLLRILSLLFIISFQVNANNIIVNGTRFIFPSNEKEITIQLNNTADRPAVAQVWLDRGDARETPDNISVPFIIIPPISRVDGKSGQTLRVRLPNRNGMLSDREQLWWLNLLEIPPTPTSAQMHGNNTLQLAIRSRFKFIYRPTGLGDRDAAPELLVLSKQGEDLAINNPTPFYITITRILQAGNKLLLGKTVIVSPLSTTRVTPIAAFKSGDHILINNVNDYGATVSVNSRIK